MDEEKKKLITEKTEEVAEIYNVNEYELSPSLEIKV